MKVLLTSPTYPPFNSGLGNAVRRQAEAISQRGISVVVATGGIARNTRWDGAVRVEEFAVTGAEQLLRNPIRGDVAGYVGFLLTEPYDVIIMNAWQTWSTDVPMKVLRQITCKKYLYSHCISTNTILTFAGFRSYLNYLLWRPYWWSLGSKMKLLDGIIFLSREGSDNRFDDLRLARHVGTPVFVIPNSLPSKRELYAGAERRKLIAVGSYTAAKGFDFVLNSYAKSSARNILPLDFFGQEYTSYTDVLRRRVLELGLDPASVTFHEGVEGQELLKHYASALVFISGSHTECQPLVLIDAMEAGTPFVARSTGCIATMPGGLSVRGESEAAAGIDQILGEHGAWEKLSSAGRAAALETYAFDRNADLIMSLVHGTLQADVIA